MKGRIFQIQRFSIHDGPGIRTTVFMKGCPLSCAWCHNPEGMGLEPLLSFVASKCIGCGYCFRTCPNKVHRMDPEKGHVLDREGCEGCGACTTECYAKALELAGRDVSVEEVMKEVLRDRPFYETSGGGLTLSGGEPMLQIDFTEAILERAKAEGLHCCVDTCGFTEWRCLERLLPLVDLFLYDYKETDTRRHEEYTGVSSKTILRNLHSLHERGANIRLRCPIIPGYNDREDHFAGIAALAQQLPDVTGVELLPYNSLGESKAERFGIDEARHVAARVPDSQTVNEWVTWLKQNGVNMVNHSASS